jgi:hypothetical protein
MGAPPSSTTWPLTVKLAEVLFGSASLVNSAFIADLLAHERFVWSLVAGGGPASAGVIVATNAASPNKNVPATRQVGMFLLRVVID